MKIAFIDHHLNNYHANTFLKLIHGQLAELGGQVTVAWESDPTGDDWCAVNNIPRAAGIAEAIAQVDAVILLAPDNIEEHLKLAKEVLPAGKPTMIDKFLATNLAEAKQIAALAEQSRTAIFSSSALRFAVELEEVSVGLGGETSDAWARGMGKWAGYGIHSLTMVQRLMGVGAKRVADTGTETARLVTIEFEGGRKALVEVRQAGKLADFTWQFGATVNGELRTGVVSQYEGFYTNLMRETLNFFKTGQSSMPLQEALEAVAVLEAADQSLASGGAWQSISL